MRMAYLNLIDDIAASAFTALGSAVGYPIENVQEQRLSVRWRSAAVTAQTVIIDFGTEQTVTTAAILGHNISSSATASSILLSARADTGFTAGNVIATLTRNENAILKFFTGAPFRYFQFSIDDPSNTDGYLDIGRLWLGDYITVSPSSLLGFTVIKRRSDMVSFGKNRQKFATPGENWRRFEFAFPPTGGSALTAIQTMYDAVGNHSAFVFTNLDTDYSYPLVYPCYVSIDGDLTFTHDKYQRYAYGLQMEECK
jgi:hypothetical protein